MVTVRYGCILPSEVGDFQSLLEIAQYCERLGYDSIWVNDHLSPYWVKTGETLECWTTLAALASRTMTVKIGTLVTNVNLRNPALLAKMAATVDVISRGRLILGLGTGDELSHRELYSYGYAIPSPRERVRRLRETINIVKAMWTEDKASFKGALHRVNGAVNLPKPIQKPHPPIWIGGVNPKILDMIAQSADGWNYWRWNQTKFLKQNRYLTERCRKHGRQVNEIVKSWAGAAHPLASSKRGRGNVLSSFSGLLKEIVDSGTHYVIGALGPLATRNDYQAFAEAVSSSKAH